MEPFLDYFLLVAISEGFLSQVIYFGGRRTETEIMIEEEVVEFVRAHEVFPFSV